MSDVTLGNDVWVKRMMGTLFSTVGRLFKIAYSSFIGNIKYIVDIPSSKIGCENGLDLDFLLKVEDPSLNKIVNKISEKKGTMIFYGSNSGTSKSYANVLSCRFSEVLVDSVVCDPNDYNMDAFFRLIADYGDKITIGFIVSSYGEGGPTDNFTSLFDIIAGVDVPKSNAADSQEPVKLPLSNLKYYIFGLGNSSYRDYNGASIAFDRNLQRLGATRVGELGMGDERFNQEGTFNEWQNVTVKLVLSETYHDVNSEDYKLKYRSLPYISPFYFENKTELPRGKNFIVAKGCINLPHGRRWEWNENSSFFPSYTELLILKVIFCPSRSQPYYAKVVSSKLMFCDTFDEFTIQDKSLPWVFPDLNDLPCKAELSNGVFKVERQCVHIDLDITGGLGLLDKYVSGGHINVIPRNNPIEVQRLIDALDWSDATLNTPIKLFTKPEIRFSNRKPPLPYAFSPLDGFKFYFDVTSVITQDKLDILARLCTNKAISDLLFELAIDYEKYEKLIRIPRRTLSDVLLDIKTPINLSVDVVFGSLLNEIQARTYSIASSSAEKKNLISIVAVVARYSVECPPLIENGTGYIRGREGLTTSWMHYSVVKNLFKVNNVGAQISDGHFPESYIPVYLGEGSFKLPPKKNTPIIMVGPGTGVAPFRAFIRERLTQVNANNTVGTTILFYGSRSEKNHLYKDEFYEIMKTKPNSFDLRIFTAYSRQPDKPCIYVNDLMLGNHQLIWDILTKNKGCIYLCGESSTIGRSFRKTMQQIFEMNSKSSNDTSQNTDFISILAKEGRYFEELW